MQKNNNERNGLAGRGQSRRILLAAVAAMGLASSAFGQLYFDTNGTGSNLGTGTATWDLTTANWATSETPGTAAPGLWVQNDIAYFDGGTVQVAPNTDIQVSGIEFDGGSGTAAAPNFTVSGTAGPWELDFGSNNFTITQNTTAKQFIAVPFIGSGNMTINVIKTPTGSDASAVVLAGNMSGFTGNIYLNNDEATPPSSGFTMANSATLHIDTSMSGGTIYMDQDTALYSTAAQVTGAGTAGDIWTGNTAASPLYFSMGDNIVLNYNGTNESQTGPVTNYIGSGGPATISGVKYSKVEVYTGVISSPAGVTSNLLFGGQNTGGTIILDNQETYNGSTTIAMSASNAGLVELAVQNTLPAATALIMGNAGNASGVDFDGHDETIASLTTGTTNTGATNVGNIYNLSVNNSTLGFVQNPNSNPATLTITPVAANTTPDNFKGDIGDTDTSSTFFTYQPYAGANVTSALSNISLVVNGPTGGGTYSLELSPVTSLTKGDEYSGTTTINANATLILNRQTAYTLTSLPTSGISNTVTGTGQVNVASGGTLASGPTTFGGTPTYAGGFAGQINLSSGSTIAPGGIGGTGVLATSGAINVSSGASLDFDLDSISKYDQIYANGGMQLDSKSGTHTLNVSLVPGTALWAGAYNLIIGSISNDDANADGFTLNTSSITTTDKMQLLDNGSGLQLLVSGNVLRWDPSSTGATSGVQEGGGTWQDGSSFLNYSTTPFSEVSWNNSSYLNYDVQLGGDNSGNYFAGEIDLGENITIGGKLLFAPLFPYSNPDDNYSIVGNGHSLTLNGGIVVNTGDITSAGGPSGVISAPIILGASQTWEIDAGEYLDVEGSINDNGSGYTLNVVGAPGATSGGTLFLNASGSIGALNVEQGIVLMGVADAVGANTLITLNGGGVQYACNATPANPFTVGPNGGYLGATSQSPTSGPYNVTFNGALSGAYTLTTIGSGNLTFTSAINVQTFTNSTSTAAGGGNVILAASDTFGSLNVTSGSLTVNGSANTIGTINVTGGTLNLNGNNTITAVAGTPTISISGGGTLVAGSPAALSSSTTPMISLAPTSGNNGGNLSLPGFTSLPNNIYLGTNGAANMSIIENVTGSGGLILNGSISGAGNIGLNGPEFTIAGNNTDTNSIDFTDPGMLIHVTSATAFGTATIGVYQNATLDVETDTTAHAIRSSSTIATALIKTGPDTLTLAGAALTPSVAGSAIDIQQGEVVMQNYQSLGGTSTSNIYLNIQVDSGATLATDFNSGTTRTSGSVTLNSGTVIHDATSTGDAYFGAASASDVWTINGNSLIDEAENGVTSSAVFRVTNPVVVTSGSTLTVESDDTTDNISNDSLTFSGPASLTDTSTGLTTTPDTYNTFTIQSGATVTEAGPGNIRFGRTASQGIAIIGQGAPNASLPNNGESLMRLGSNVYMTDVVAANNMITALVVDGSGGEGLRIEAAMNATYTSASTGTTGLFGIDSFSPTSGNVYTVLSPNRALAISSPYNYVDINNKNIGSITPSGTLTLAATDAAGATGLINDGPAVQSNVSLALANGTGSGGKLIYQISAATNANGGSFGNFAGLTVEQNSATSNAHVVAQLKDNTKVPTLSITGGASVDITNQALVVDAGTGAPPTAQIEAYLKSAYDKGNWDGPGIGTSNTQLGTSIGYVENDALATPFSSSILFGGTGGQPVSNSAVLVLDTWLGDLNLDGVVDSTDFGLMGNIPTSGPLAGQIGWFDGDLNYDGVINADDYSLFQLGDAAQTGTRTSAVPEPAAISLLAIGGGAMLRRRRRAFN